MGNYDSIQIPVQGQPVSSSLHGVRVRNAILDLDTRVTGVEIDQQAIVARGRRITAKTVASGSAGTEFGYMRIDNIPVKANSAYRIMTSGINMDTDVANDIEWAKMRIAFDVVPGTTAGLSSPPSGSVRLVQPNISQSQIAPMSVFYYASADGYISVLVTGQRIVGTGSLVFYASSTEPFDLTIEYAGPTPPDTSFNL